MAHLKNGMTDCMSCPEGEYGAACSKCASGYFQKLVIKVPNLAIPNCATNAQEVSGVRMVGQPNCLPCFPGKFQPAENLRHAMTVLSVILEEERISHLVQDVHWLSRAAERVCAVKPVQEVTMARAARHVALECTEMGMMMTHLAASRVSLDSFSLWAVNCLASSAILVCSKFNFRKRSA